MKVKITNKLAMSDYGLSEFSMICGKDHMGGIWVKVKRLGTKISDIDASYASDFTNFNASSDCSVGYLLQDEYSAVCKCCYDL